ncbi:Leukotriene B4 receptor 1 [Merluccius polli]|uniref:Leukotriene B4 receptor 1 n=1 Tax=Merluccius polli TaxID=89951 RepID=A0AA47MS15_MERPO|nr:Leukotriene B4 receptor 1 [Merluccius polli]
MAQNSPRLAEVWLDLGCSGLDAGAASSRRLPVAVAVLPPFSSAGHRCLWERDGAGRWLSISAVLDSSSMSLSGRRSPTLGASVAEDPTTRRNHNCFLLGPSDTRHRKKTKIGLHTTAVIASMASLTTNQSLNMSTRNFEDPSLVSNDFSTAMGALILGIVFLLGVPGNLFVAWSILARARQRSVTTLLIFNLACADSFLMALTIFFVIYLAKQTWVFGRPMCKILFYLCNVNMYASIFIITLMSLHRLVAVVWPLKLGYVANKKIMTRVIVGLWLLVILIALPSLVFRKVDVDRNETNGTRLVCEPEHKEAWHVMFQYAFETVAGFILPYTIIMTSYVLILRRLKQTKFRLSVRSEKLILGIVVTFCLFWMPYHIINIIQVAAEWYETGSPTRSKLDNIWKSSRAVTSALAFISSCANPVLYTFAGKAYIKRDGVAFMARLFEGTSLEQSETKKSRKSNFESVTSSRLNGM